MQQASLHQKVFHDDEGAERPDTGLSEAKKAEKKRAKKARQRSARAQAAAQKGTDKAQALDKGAADEASSPPKENESASSVLAQALAGYTIPEQPEGGSKTPADAKEGPGKQAAPASSITKGLHNGAERGKPEKELALPETLQPNGACIAATMKDLVNGSGELSRSVSAGSPTERVPQMTAQDSKSSTRYGASPSQRTAGSASAQNTQHTEGERLPEQRQHKVQIPSVPGHAWHSDSSAQVHDAPEEDESWQEVRSSRRKPAAQPAAAAAQLCKSSNRGKKLPKAAPAAQNRLPNQKAQHGQYSFDIGTDAKLGPQQPMQAASEAHFLGLHLHSPTEQRAQQSVEHESVSLRPPSQAAPKAAPQQKPLHVTKKDNIKQQILHDGPILQQSTGTDTTAGSATRDLAIGINCLPVEPCLEDDEDCCVVCLDSLREVIFIPCGHMCTCQGCAKAVMTAKGLCPMCQTQIEHHMVTRF